MGDLYEYDRYYKNATCSSSSSQPAQPHSASDDMSLFLQQILVRSSSSLASVVAQPGKAPQFLFSPSPSVGALLPGNLEHPCHSGFFGDEITAIDSSAAFVSAGNPNVSSSSLGASENEADEYDCESEEGLEAFVEARPGGGRSSSKRSRAAEVHNLSEKRRRSRINEKMKALQNLIPNSNKTDKASMLDEAIEYLKQLQLQVQMLSMRNGMSLHPLYLPGTLQPVQLSQMRMELGEENRPLHLDMTGTLHMNLESSTQNLFNLSNQCTAANESYVPDMSNVVNSETSFVLEPSIQSHLGPFQLPASSQEICRDDLLQHQKIDVNHSEMNLSVTATVSLPFAQVSDPKRTFDTCIIGRDRQEVGLLRENLFEDGNHLYRFLDDDPIVSQCQNIPRGIIDVKPKPILEIASRLRFLYCAILEAYVSEDGKHVDYRSIHGSEEFARYMRIVEELQRVEVKDMKREERLAFFINLYNMMAIHAILVWGHPAGAIERKRMFGDFNYVVGGSTYSLSAIQNGILRGNQRPPYNLMKPFGAKDKRSPVALPYPEPLIHFALVCGTRSGPALRCYSPGDIDKELMEAARDFLRNGGLFIDFDSKVASANKILKWFSIDFGKNDVEVLKHSSNYLDPAVSEALLEFLADSQLKVIYQPYDWGLNC